MPDEGFRNHRGMFALVVAQVCRDGAMPVDLAWAWTPCSLRPVDGSTDDADRLVLESREQLVDYPPHYHARGLLGFLGDGRSQRHEIGDEVNIGFEGGEELRFEHERLQVQPLEGILLDDLHNRGGKKFADVAQPARDARR